ncbi:MAG: sigma-70 family RNA polymerase sigma factor [Pirellulales bacterium]|nr:sigma-70 family RNA polymerase sigma factor [Pirellulales bacterium]
MSQSTLERIASGDSLAVEECLHKYSGLVWSIARKLCSNHADAEDAVQEVFIEIWRHSARFDPQVASEATYITMIARRRLIDRLRRRSRELATTSIEEEMVESTSNDEERNEIEEEAARARRFIRQLRPEQQQIIELSITHGLSQSKISEATDMPLGTVKTHARRGLIRLKELMGADRDNEIQGDTA